MSSDSVRVSPASLWIGKRLSFLDLLCLKSFADVGQPVTLYTYGSVENVPDYVTHADAREIFDVPEILRQMAGRRHLLGSPAIHADIFRIRLLSKTAQFWVDTDAYALKPLVPIDGYLFSKVGGYVPNGVLSLPKNSPALAGLEMLVSTNGEFPPWWSDEEKTAFIDSGLPLDFRYMRWGTLGPHALRYFLSHTGEISKALNAKALYPIRAREKKRFFDKGVIDLPQGTLSIHLYASGLREMIIKDFNGVLPKNSMLYELCEKHEIDPNEAPILPAVS